MATAREVRRAALQKKFEGRKWSAYGLAILESVPEARPEDTYQIEEGMRDRFSTLDHLSYAEFRREARIAWAAVQELRTDGTFTTPTYPDKKARKTAKKTPKPPSWLWTGALTEILMILDSRRIQLIPTAYIGLLEALHAAIEARLEDATEE